MQDAPELDPDELLAPLAAAGSLLLAVSGGPDSVALMLLAARWSLRGKRQIAVATVDHGLRPGSCEEARRVGEWARQLGFPHHLLQWRGEKPKTRLQERAREARYALLTQCARGIGARAIVTAHHADDQAETILFRLVRGSAIAGLSGMAQRSALDGLALLRPLLGVRKAALEAFCEASRHPFVRDPSNENSAFARTRMRRLAGLLETEGLDPAALARLASRARRAEEALASCAARASAGLEAERDEGEFRARASALESLPRELLQRVLCAEIIRIGGQAPRLERLERLTEKIAQAIAAKAGMKTTLGKSVIALGKGELTMKREPPRRRPGGERRKA